MLSKRVSALSVGSEVTECGERMRRMHSTHLLQITAENPRGQFHSFI